MSINKQSLPKRIISLLLAVAIMVGFVPIIDIDLTAFAATYDGIELNDTTSKSSDNWVWDKDTHTLSLYNAKFHNNANGGYAIKYTGTDTLKIKQIGYNLIENGYIQAESGSIEVIGTGILDINHNAEAMFNTPNLKITDGYVRSDNATTLNKCDGNKTTVSNCVLDIPQAEIVAKAQTDDTAGFIMKSGYVNCSRLTTKYNASNYLAAEIKGGYLKVGTINGEINPTNYAYIDIYTAVVKADTLGANAAFSQNGTDDNAMKGILIFKTDSSGLNYANKFLTSNFNRYSISDGYTLYEDTTANIYYYDSDLNYVDEILADTIVCNGTITFDGRIIGTNTTVYANSFIIGENYLSKNTNGLLIGETITLGANSTVSSTGRIYGETLTLNGSATIAEGGAVTVYNNNNNLFLPACQFNNKSLTVNGDFSVIKRDGSVFGDTEKNITVGATGQLAVVGNVDYNGGGFVSETVYNAITDNISRTVYASNSYSNNAMDCKKYSNPSTAYIGKEFNPQLLALNSARIMCEKAYGAA